MKNIHTTLHECHWLSLCANVCLFWGFFVRCVSYDVVTVSVLDPAAEGSVFEPESYTQPSHTAAAGQCCASLHSSSSTSATEEKDDRQRTVSLPAQGLTNHIHLNYTEIFIS